MNAQQFDHFHFDMGLEENFLAYARMRYFGAVLTRDNFFSIVFYEGPIAPQVTDLIILHNIRACKPYAALSGFNAGRNYNTVLQEIQEAFEFFYARWITVHTELEQLLIAVTRNVLASGGVSLRATQWDVTSYPVRREVLRYGSHIGALANIADQYLISSKARTHMLQDELPIEIRAQYIVMPHDKTAFASLKAAF